MTRILQIRRASLDLDYPDIIQWWIDQDRSILPWEMLPTMSFLCEDRGEKISVCWLYCSDSVTGFVGWFTVNPSANKKLVSQSARLTDECVEGAARAAGLKFLFQFSGGGGFTRKLVKSGWKNTMIQHDFLMKEI